MGKLGYAHATSLVLYSLRPQASTIISRTYGGRGRFVQARPAMRPATSRCQAQAQPVINQTAGNPLSTTLLTASAYHILHSAMLASKDPNQTPAGLNLRAGDASRAPPRCPPRGLARPLRYAPARRNSWAQGRCRQALCRCCCWCQALPHHIAAITAAQGRRPRSTKQHLHQRVPHVRRRVGVALSLAQAEHAQ